MESSKKFDQQSYINEYQKKNYKKITFRLSKDKDIDIIEALENAENDNEFIKESIRNNIKK